jgi:hypothetical protein
VALITNLLIGDAVEVIEWEEQHEIKAAEVVVLVVSLIHMHMKLQVLG